MNQYELIDKLCAITTMQADIIRRQQAVIMQHGIEVEDEALQQQIDKVTMMMDIAEMDINLR